MLEIVQEFQFQTSYTYEVSTSWGIELYEWQTEKDKAISFILFGK
ncbi:Protein of unknown function [Bacillus mobilis]|nr:Protein of unknown function [Bacillus mobilis]